MNHLIRYLFFLFLSLHHKPSAMNPFSVAKSYTDAGYHVVMVDLDAVRKQGLDTEHVIGCEILGVSCKDGFITGLSEESFEANSEKHDVLTHGFTDLVEEDIINMEKLFRFRDWYGLFASNRLHMSHYVVFEKTCTDNRPFSLFSHTPVSTVMLRTTRTCISH